QEGKAEPVDVDAVRAILERIRMKMMDDSPEVEEAVAGSFHQEMAEVRQHITQFIDTIGHMPAADVHQVLAAFQKELDRDLAEKLAMLEANLQAEPVTIEDLPPELRARYVGKTGRYRILVYPAEDIWEFQPLARFVTDVRTVDADVIGTPVTNFEFTR